MTKNPKRKSKQPKYRTKKIRVGVAWYETESEWEEVRAFAADPDRLEETYEEWLSVAEDALKEVASTGVVTEKVYLDAKTLKEWCRNNDKKNDGSARAELASRLIQAKYEQNK